jgi:hypothetical protein
MIHRRATFRSPAFVLVAALLMLAFVGAATTVLVEATSDDAGRTFDQFRHAQLEQLLLAGTHDAVIHIKRKSPTQGDSWDTALPDVFSPQKVSLHSTITSIAREGKADVLIRARMDKRAAEQLVHFERAGDGWRVVAAELTQP